MSNVIASLIYGRRFKYKDPLLLKLLDLMEDALKEESGLMNQVGEGGDREPCWASSLRAGGASPKSIWGGASEKGHSRRGHCKRKGLEVEKVQTEMGEEGLGQPAQDSTKEPAPPSLEATEPMRCRF